MIHIVYVINVSEKTDETRKIEMVKENAGRDKPRFQYFEDYVRYLKNWGEYRYCGTARQMGYFMSKEDAAFAVKENVGDINEAGAYPYAAVLTVKTGCMYGNLMTDDDDIVLFSFDKDDGVYQPFDRSDDLARYMKHLIRGVLEPEDIEA